MINFTVFIIILCFISVQHLELLMHDSCYINKVWLIWLIEFLSILWLVSCSSTCRWVEQISNHSYELLGPLRSLSVSQSTCSKTQRVFKSIWNHHLVKRDAYTQCERHKTLYNLYIEFKNVTVFLYLELNWLIVALNTEFWKCFEVWIFLIEHLIKVLKLRMSTWQKRTPRNELLISR